MAAVGRDCARECAANSITGCAKPNLARRLTRALSPSSWGRRRRVLKDPSGGGPARRPLERPSRPLRGAQDEAWLTVIPVLRLAPGEPVAFSLKLAHEGPIFPHRRWL